MDTICYLSRCRHVNNRDGAVPYAVREYLFPDYRLLRIELEEPFGTGMPESGPPIAGRERGRKGLSDRMRALWSRTGLLPFFAEYKKKKAFRRARESLLGELSAILDPYGENYGICGGTLAGRLKPQELLGLPEFDCYLDQDWVERLLPYAIYPHFIVLGNVPYLPELFRALARKMKSLLWVLPDHYYTEMLEDFAEDFYQEYGLAIDLRFLEADVTYGQAQVEAGSLKGPANVLDFTENKGIPHINLPDGSVWLDMASVGEKERKLLARGCRVTYFSLKKQWEEPQKVPCLLDTVPKNRYNTVG